MSDAAHTPAGSQPTTGSVADTEMTRGQFLTAATVGIGGVMGLLLAAPVAGMALGPVFGGEDFEAVLVGKVDEFKEGSFTKVVLMPHLEKPDAYVRRLVAFVRVNSQDDSGNWSDKLALKGQEKYSVVSNVCMHLGCPVKASTSGFVCPCHGGSYDADGKRLAGPPVRPLDRFIWEERGDELWATAIYSLNNDGDRKTHRDAGQHTEGPQQWFYALQP